MQLQYIKTDKCPICGTDIIVEESVEVELYQQKIKVHAFGGRWEHRRFVCGQEIIYSPQGSGDTLDTYHRCKNDPELQEKERKKEEAKKEVMNLINSLDVDESTKRSWRLFAI